MKTTNIKRVVFLTFLLAHISIYAQYSGGDADGASLDMVNNTSCALPNSFFPYFGGVADGASTDAFSNTTCGTANFQYAYLGGNADGASTEEISTTSCGIPPSFFAYFGGNNDGATVNDLFATTCAFPPQFYAYFGGDGDGFSLDKTAPICPTAPPVADFTASATAVCVGQSVTFTDTSTNIPSAWTWTIPGATPNNSTIQNPMVVYNTPGTYSVTLVAANFNGADTEAKTGYITVTAIPTVTATTPNSRCDAGTITLGATASAGILNWYAAATGGTALGTGVNFITPSISGTTTYYVETVSGTCSSSRVAVIATVNATPTITATTPNSRCNTGSVMLNATPSAGSTIWYSAATGGTPLATTNSFATPSISATTTYYVEATAGSCTSPRTAVIATVNTTPTITATTPGSRCDAGSVTLNATASAGNTLWYNAPTGGSALATTNTFVTPSITSTTTYYVEAATVTCTSTRTAVTATINATPTINSTSPNSRCDAGVVTLNASATAGTLSWYANATGGTALATGGTYTTPSISTTTTYYVESANGICISPRVAIIATVNTTPTIVSTTPNSRCDSGSVTLNATASAGSTIWYAVPTGGSTLATTNLFTTPSITSTTTFYVEATTGSCTSTRTAVIAIVNNSPTITSTTPNSRCAAGSVTLNATASAGTLNWYTVPTGGSSLFTGAAFVTPSISGTTTYYVEATNGTCISARTSVTATINNTNAPTGFSNQTFCAGETVGLLVITGTNIIWYDAGSAGNVVPDNTPLVSGTTYYASQNTGSCESATRLAVTATNGNCLGNNEFVFEQIKLYPNPVNTLLNISNTQVITRIQVVDMLGKMIYCKSINDTDTKIDMSNLPTGMYLIEVTAENQRKIFKVIKQ